MIPVILSGGSGSRLWPLSRKQFPKQFLALTGNHTLFQQTLERLKFDELFVLELGLAAGALGVTVQGIVVTEVAHAAVAEKLTLGALWRQGKPVVWRILG